jgi:hypothetical protein
MSYRSLKRKMDKNIEVVMYHVYTLLLRRKSTGIGTNNELGKTNPADKKIHISRTSSDDKG